jgi:hypothetical protein
MTVPRSPVRPTLAALLGTFVLPAAAIAGGPTTTWNGSSGSWADGARWSAGEPTASHTAIVGSGTAQIGASGEVCDRLLIAQGGSTGAVSINAGDLTVGTEIVVGESGIGSFTQFAGTVSVPTLTVLAGGYTLGSGTLVVTDCVVGDGGGLGSMSMGFGPTSATVANDWTVESGSTLTIGGGVQTVGTDPTDALIVRGGLAVTNPDRTTTLTNLTMEGPTAFFSVGIGSLGLSTVSVTGTFTRAGLLTLTDDDAADGRYDVVTSGAIAGDFATVVLPDGWSWGIDGTTFWVAKNTVPTETKTWGSLKQGFTE